MKPKYLMDTRPMIKKYFLEKKKRKKTILAQKKWARWDIHQPFSNISIPHKERAKGQSEIGSNFVCFSETSNLV